MSVRRRVAPHLDSIETDERRRIAAHGFAVGVVAGAALLGWILRTSTDEPQFWLFHVAIALSAVYGWNRGSARCNSPLGVAGTCRVGSSTFDGMTVWP